MRRDEDAAALTGTASERLLPLVSRRPRRRYLVGLDARGQALFFRLMPEAVVDKAAARMFDL